MVINRISLEDARKAAKSTDVSEMVRVMCEELKGYNPPLCRLFVGIPAERSFRFLARADDDLSERETVSVCIAFDDIKVARKMVQDGAFAYGKHYKVSWYRSRSRR